MYKYNIEKVYLDQQPELNDIVKDFVTNLTPDYNDGHSYSEEAEEIECRSRSGFSAAGHNHGGFERQWATDLMNIWGSGIGLGDNITTDEAHEGHNNAVECFVSENEAEFKDIPEDKRNYHDMYEMGFSKLAETMDEYAMDWLSGCRISFGYRAMYEGKQGAWHTLVIYACAIQCEYNSAFRGDTLKEIEIKFRNATELQSKLDKIKTELESVFRTR